MWNWAIDIALRNKLCLACKKKLSDDYEFSYCCSGRDCGCHGLPTEPWACCVTCEDLAWCGNYVEYRHMWS